MNDAKAAAKQRVKELRVLLNKFQRDHPSAVVEIRAIERELVLARAERRALA
jgi:hypothetical protein